MLQSCKGIICHFWDIQSSEQKLKAHCVLVSACWRVLKTNNQPPKQKPTTKHKKSKQETHKQTHKPKKKHPQQQKKISPFIHEGPKKSAELMARSAVLGVTGTFSVEPRELESGPGWLTQDTKCSHYCPEPILVLLFPLCCQDKGTVHF